MHLHAITMDDVQGAINSAIASTQVNVNVQTSQISVSATVVDVLNGVLAMNTYFQYALPKARQAAMQDYAFTRYYNG